MRALSAFFAAMAIDTAAEASVQARTRAQGARADAPLPPIRPGAWARWAAQRQPGDLMRREARRSALRTGIAQRRA